MAPCFFELVGDYNYERVLSFSPRSQYVLMVPLPLIEISPLGWRRKVPNKSSKDLVEQLTWIFSGSPLLSIREAVLTASPKRQNRGLIFPVPDKIRNMYFGQLLVAGPPPPPPAWLASPLFPHLPTQPAQQFPVFIPIRNFSFSSGWCFIWKSGKRSSIFSAMRQICLPCSMPLRSGSP